MKREEQRPHGKKNNMYMQEGIGVRAQRGGVWEWKGCCRKRGAYIV